MAETSASPEVANRPGQSGNKKERVVSDPLLIVACGLNQSFDGHIGENNRQFKQAVAASHIAGQAMMRRDRALSAIALTDW